MKNGERHNNSLFAAFAAGCAGRIPCQIDIVFDYAGAAIPEDGPLTDDRVKCLISHLMDTGIFADVKVELKAGEQPETADVTITPEVWAPRIERSMLVKVIQQINIPSAMIIVATKITQR